ncbi:hypothetical protein RchiOBHm_Chr7g0229791 [Rosa chinensis]|uniref:Uncharacterized protein n=1 Tax=Rosa chinensis TaxID=74649 RepID=A0A2P6PF79_ROSCH|nr:hypothetical protein RchiOBHm_Chr7g0229791 [Rosa chinensis]
MLEYLLHRLHSPPKAMIMFLLLFSYELHHQLGLMDISRHVSVITVDPGVVESNIMREVPPCLCSLAFKVLRRLCLLQSPEVGISSILDSALAPPETSGVYFFWWKGPDCQLFYAFL